MPVLHRFRERTSRGTKNRPKDLQDVFNSNQLIVLQEKKKKKREIPANPWGHNKTKAKPKSAERQQTHTHTHMELTLPTTMSFTQTGLLILSFQYLKPDKAQSKCPGFCETEPDEHQPRSKIQMLLSSFAEKKKLMSPN